MTGDDPNLPVAPIPTLRKYYRAPEERVGFVGSLFDAAAAKYDAASAVLSFGTDRAYRRRALIEHGAVAGMKILDVGCGTGLVTMPASEIVGPSGIVIGLDPSDGMLRHGVHKGRIAVPVRGRGEALPFASGTFDMVCMGYALRHVADLTVTFREFHRVLRPGGSLLVLEITEPVRPAARILHRFYMRWIVPLASGVATFNRNVAKLMTFYSDTIATVVQPRVVLDAMARAGFSPAQRHVKLGLFSEYVGRRKD